MILNLTGGCAVIPEAEPDIDALKNLTYHGIYSRPVLLNDGLYVGELFVSQGVTRPYVQFVEQLYRYGDLNKEGLDEAVVFLTENSGGTGVNTYMAVVSRDSGQLVNVATRLIGGRVQIRSLNIEQGELVLEYVTSGPNEPLCCPTLKQRSIYHFDRDKIIEMKTEQLGQISLRDLEGTTWTLIDLDWCEPVPEGITVNALFNANKVSGSGGCNRYFASVTWSGSNEITIGAVGSTRMACPSPTMRVEYCYLSALQKIKKFNFVFGNLVLVYEDETTWKSLIYKPTH